MSINQSSIANSELMFNRQLMQDQIFIKNSPTESALQKTFLPCKIKNIVVAGKNTVITATQNAD